MHWSCMQWWGHACHRVPVPCTNRHILKTSYGCTNSLSNSVDLNYLLLWEYPPWSSNSRWVEYWQHIQLSYLDRWCGFNPCHPFLTNETCLQSTVGDLKRGPEMKLVSVCVVECWMETQKTLKSAGDPHHVIHTWYKLAISCTCIEEMLYKQFCHLQQSCICSMHRTSAVPSPGLEC